MRQIIVLIALALSTGLAQNDSATLEPERGGIYAGASLGVGTGFALPLSAHVGFKDVAFDGVDTRVDLSTYILTGATVFELGINEVYGYQILPDLPLELQGGGGVRLLFGGGAVFGVGIVAGADYGLSEQLDLFGELRFDSYLGGLATKFALGVGVKYHL